MFVYYTRTSAKWSLRNFKVDEVKEEKGEIFIAQNEARVAFRIVVEHREGRRLLGRHVRRYEDNIKMDHKCINWILMTADSIELGAVVSTVQSM
jgi:hypothetical protein